MTVHVESNEMSRSQEKSKGNLLMIFNIQQHHKTASHGLLLLLLEKSDIRKFRKRILILFYCKIHHIANKLASLNPTK